MYLYINNRIINDFDNLKELLNEVDVNVDNSKRQNIIDDVIYRFADGSLISWLKEENRPMGEILLYLNNLYDEYKQQPKKFTDDRVLFARVIGILTNKTKNIVYVAADYICIEDIIIKVNDKDVTGNSIYINQNIVSPYVVSIQYKFRVLKTLNSVFLFSLFCDSNNTLNRTVVVDISGSSVGSIVYSSEIKYNALKEFKPLSQDKHKLHLMEVSREVKNSDIELNVNWTYDDGPLSDFLGNIHRLYEENTIIEYHSSPIFITSVNLFDENDNQIMIRSSSRKALVNVKKIPNQKLVVKVEYQINTNEKMNLNLTPSIGENQILHIEEGQFGHTCIVLIPIDNIDMLKHGENLFEIKQATKDDLKVVLCLYGGSISLPINGRTYNLISGYDIDEGLFYLTEELVCKEAGHSPKSLIDLFKKLNEANKERGIIISLPQKSDIKQLGSYLEEAPIQEYIDEIESHLIAADERYAIGTRNVDNCSKYTFDSIWSISYRYKVKLKSLQDDVKIDQSNPKEVCQVDGLPDWYVDKIMKYD